MDVRYSVIHIFASVRHMKLRLKQPASKQLQLLYCHIPSSVMCEQNLLCAVLR